jgi:AGZA family xanthine/uracil permease-like MFS transporter
MGLFLIFIGMKNVGLLVPGKATLFTIGNLRSPEILLTALSLIVISVLMARGYRIALFAGLAVAWGIGYFLGKIPWNGAVAWPPSLDPTLLKLDWRGVLKPEFIPIILSLLFVSLFDSAGTLLGLAEQGDFLDKKGKLPRANRALVNDAIGTIAGSLLGTTPTVPYLESAAGISVGGHYGITAIVVSLLLLASLFLGPFISAIPNFVTAPIMIFVGAMLLKQVQKIHWSNPIEFIPSAIILLTIPLTYSISTGIALGFIIYPVIKALAGRWRDIHYLVWIIAALFLLRFVNIMQWL